VRSPRFRQEGAVPQFHFDVTDGDFIPDLGGTVLPDLEAARRHAVLLAGALLTENSDKFWLGETWMIEVRDDCGLALLTMAFSARETPVARSARQPVPAPDVVEP
jgi:hypothetical protein